MRKVLSAMTLAVVTLLAGCASMSESECRVADWGRVGFADGARGDSESRLAAYTEDCGKIGITPNATAYRQGWDTGIVQFCTPANGWQEGQRGHSGKLASCQGQPGYELFARYLDAGMQVYRTAEEMERNDREVNRLQKRLEESAKDDEKRKLRDELRHLDHQQFHLRNRLAQQQMLGP
ncbi:MAG: DUF2799 domain-containing protein [Burkholderiales bacterium]|jgi:hypothetical protein|nr:DUF2799 domain-containing protein [Burkholderiales bacterium]MBK9347576.1 DUF2799 domain-containing protein [Burkholderiales bacterium]